MAYGYKNKTEFVRPAKVNFICASTTSDRAFAVQSFNADNLHTVPAGAVRASDNLVIAEQEAQEANEGAGYIFDPETRTYHKPTTQETTPMTTTNIRVSIDEYGDDEMNGIDVDGSKHLGRNQPNK